MAIDNTMTYRVRLDDSDFQAKLTQMRASMDTTFGGAGMGASSASMMSYMNSFQTPYGGTPGMVSPISFSPTPMAMTPNMGQFSIQQGFTNTLSGAFTGQPAWNTTPAGISVQDYMAYSQRSLADSASRGFAIAASSSFEAGVGILSGGLGAAAGGAMFGAKFGGPIGAIVGMIAGGVATSPVGTAVADNFRIQEYLANTSFRYMTGAERDPMTGRGFNRSARQDISQFIMDTERNDFRVNMADVENILTKGTSAGLFEGTRDVEDFKSKFKGLVDKVKRITSTLNTTASEGIEVLRMYKDMGITDTSSVMGMAAFSDAAAIASGRTGMEMTAIGAQGAGIFKGTGINMRYGFQMNQMNAARAQMAFTNGVINADELAQAGGVEGIAATATANTLAGLQSGTGRMFAMSLFDRNTMSLDAGRFGGNISSTASRAAGAFGGPQDVLRYDLYQRKMLNDFGGQFGGMGMEVLDMGLTANLMSAGRMAGLQDTESQVRYAAKMRGITDEAQIKMMVDKFINPNGMKDQMMNAASLALSKQTVEDFRDKSMIMHMGEAMKDIAAKTFTDPVARFATTVGNMAGTATEGFLISASKGDIIRGRGRDVSDFALSKGSAQTGIINIDTTGLTGGLFGGRFMSGAADTLARQVEEKLNHDAAMTNEGQTVTIGNRTVRVFGSADDANSAAKAIGSASVIKANMGSVGDFTRGNYYIVTDRNADAQAAEKDRKYTVSKEMLDKAISKTTDADRDIAYNIEANSSDNYLRKLAASGALGERAKKAVANSTSGDAIDILKPDELAKARGLAKLSKGQGAKDLTTKTQGGFVDFSSSEKSRLSDESEKARSSFERRMGRSVFSSGLNSSEDIEMYDLLKSEKGTSALIDYAEGKKGSLAELLGRDKADKVQAAIEGSSEKAQFIDDAKKYRDARLREIEFAAEKLKATGEKDVDAKKGGLMDVFSRAFGVGREDSSPEKMAEALKTFTQMSQIIDNIVKTISKNNPNLLR